MRYQMRRKDFKSETLNQPGAPCAVFVRLAEHEKELMRQALEKMEREAGMRVSNHWLLNRLLRHYLASSQAGTASP